MHFKHSVIEESSRLGAVEVAARLLWEFPRQSREFYDSDSLTCLWRNFVT